MATEVLQTQDLLGERFRLPTASFHPRRAVPANGRLAMKRKQQGKPSPAQDKSRSNGKAVAKRSSHREVTDRRPKVETAKISLVSGQVTLLRRGESLSLLPPKIPKSTESVKIPPKNIRVVAAPPADKYAGMTFISSPSPRSLPLPTFFSKKDDAESFQDDASRCLRRMLRLE